MTSAHAKRPAINARATLLGQDASLSMRPTEPLDAMSSQAGRRKRGESRLAVAEPPHPYRARPGRARSLDRRGDRSQNGK
jgi:hypothetical protein